MKKFAIPPASSEVVGDGSVVGSGPPSLLQLKQNFYILDLKKENLQVGVTTANSHGSSILHIVKLYIMTSIALVLTNELGLFS